MGARVWRICGQTREEVWASANKVEDLQVGVADLRALPELTCVYLEHNPAALDQGSEAYRATLKRLLPGLTQIDATSA